MSLATRVAPTAAQTFIEYAIPTANSQPWGITAGPDGNVWFTEYGVGANKIGKVTPSGTFTEYALPTAYSGPSSIVTGPDGRLWFTEFEWNKIGKITTTGMIIEYTLPTGHFPADITVGPDGNLWFTEFEGGSNKIGKVTTGGSFTEYTIPTAVSDSAGITVGPVPNGGTRERPITGITVNSPEGKRS